LSENKQVAIQETVQVPSVEQTTVQAPVPTSARGVKPDLKGTSPIRINYSVGNVTVSVNARHHTMSAKEVQAAVKRQMVIRDVKGQRVIYRQTPYRFGYFAADDNGQMQLQKIQNAQELVEEAKCLAEMHKLLAENEPEEENSNEVPLGIVAMNGELFRPIEIDKTTVKRYFCVNGKEEAIAALEKTRQFDITEENLRSTITAEQYLVERVKEIFAVEENDVQGLWHICKDLIDRDQVAVIQSFVEKEGYTEYRIILKPYHLGGKFIILGAVVRVPFELRWLMDVPGPSTATEKPPKKVSFLNVAGQKEI
jgi:hypothetical protein